MLVRTQLTPTDEQYDRKGDLKIDPITRIIKNLITSKQAQQFCPIPMMDPNNDDWLDKSSKLFKAFVDEMPLSDPLHKTFGSKGITHITYSRGTRRIDFILVDLTIGPVIKKIETLGLH